MRTVSSSSGRSCSAPWYHPRLIRSRASWRMHCNFCSEELGGPIHTIAPASPCGSLSGIDLEEYGFKGVVSMATFSRLFKWSQPNRPAKEFVEVLSAARANLYFGDFYIPSEGGQLRPPGQGPEFFVEREYSSPSQHHDDYAGLDVQRKIVLVVPRHAARDVDIRDSMRDEHGQGAARAHGSRGSCKLPPQGC